MNDSKGKTIKLSKVCTKITDGTHFTPIYTDKGVIFLSVKNVRKNRVFFDDTKFISEQEHKKLVKRCNPISGDILLTKVGNTYGLAAVIPDNSPEFSIFVSLALLKINKSKINSYFVMYFLNSQFGKIQMDRFIKGIGQPDLHLEDIANIKIPLLSFDEQEIIINKMDNAYNSKKQKEAEAQRLLDSIDDYLLRELGIELPQPSQNTVSDRIFYRKLSDISGGRFDAGVHHKKLSLQTELHPMVQFKNHVLINPLTIFSQYKLSNEVSFIPMENISEIFAEANTSTIRIVSESKGYTKFLEDDLIWAKITPCMENGKSAVVTELKNNIGFGSTEYHVFRAKIGTNIRYIHALLRLKILRNYATLYFSGSAGHQRVSDQFFKSLLIPLPPIEKQNEIAEHITQIREQAKQLKEEAKRELEQAKIEVEKIILGE